MRRGTGASALESAQVTINGGDGNSRLAENDYNNRMVQDLNSLSIKIYYANLSLKL